MGDDEKFDEESEEDIVYSPDLSNISPTLTPEEASVIVEEEEKDEDGEFGGYKLGNVYGKERRSIKDYKNKKDIPIDLLVRKEDPTRL